MNSEETPLLKTRHGAAHEAIYDRFTSHQKKWIVFAVSCVGLLPSKQFTISYSPNARHVDQRSVSVFVQATFVPSIPQIAKDLDSTPAVVRCVLHEFWM